ncbi:MAG: hypothetical protein SGI74_12780 [Oligoflexia bacterium]|nr:hypothetical protein [Oligoflexia bacterium]
MIFKKQLYFALSLLLSTTLHADSAKKPTRAESYAKPTIVKSPLKTVEDSILELDVSNKFPNSGENPKVKAGVDVSDLDLEDLSNLAKRKTFKEFKVEDIELHYQRYNIDRPDFFAVFGELADIGIGQIHLLVDLNGRMTADFKEGETTSTDFKVENLIKGDPMAEGIRFLIEKKGYKFATLSDIENGKVKNGKYIYSPLYKSETPLMR